MVEEKIAIDASCQTEEWDETHLERYNRMKQSVCALVDQQKKDNEELDRLRRKVKALENAKQKKRRVPKAIATQESNENSQTEDQDIKADLDIEMGEEIDQLDEDDETDVPAPKKPRFSRRKRMCVQRDENGNIVLPQQIASMNVISLGKVESERPGFHTARYIFPIGYHVERLYMSTVNPDAQTTYTCKVEDGGKGPLFTLTAEDDPNLNLSAKTATSVWAIVIKKANEVRKRESANAISGPEYYGFSHPLVIEMIEELDGVDECTNYCRRIPK